MKYVEGQTVRVVSDRSSHGIADGTEVKITKVFPSPLHYGIRAEGGMTRYACEDELEGHAVALRKFKAGDKVLLNTTKPVRGSGSLLLSEGDVEGVVTGYDERDNDVIVSFPDHPRFYAVESELNLVGEVVEVQEPVVEATPSALKVGDKVRLIVRSPFYGKGEVKFHDVGTVKRISDSGVIYVDFPAQRNWMAKPSELELASVPVKASEPRADRTQAPVYVVVHEERQEDFLLVTEDREEARRVKTRKGGKRAGYIINLYAKVKEIR